MVTEERRAQDEKMEIEGADGRGGLEQIDGCHTHQ